MGDPRPECEQEGGGIERLRKVSPEVQADWMRRIKPRIILYFVLVAIAFIVLEILNAWPSGQSTVVFEFALIDIALSAWLFFDLRRQYRQWEKIYGQSTESIQGEKLA